MKKKLCIIFLVPLFLFAGNGPVSLVRIDVNGPADVLKLKDLGIDITKGIDKFGNIEAIVGKEQKSELLSMGYHIDPLIQDLGQKYHEIKSSGYFNHFHSVPQLEAYMTILENQYPELIQMVDIGDSYNKLTGQDGFDIWALKLSDEVSIDDPTESDVLYTASIHAREVITPQVLVTFINYLLEGYGTDLYSTHLINNRELWFILCVNPDGRNYVFTGDYNEAFTSSNPIIWRKNMRDNNGDGKFSPMLDGVDLNRNYGWEWGYDDYGSSPAFGSEVYRGQTPFSEPENQAIKSFVEEHDFVTSIFYHSYGNWILYPWGYDAIDPPEADLKKFKSLADSCAAFNDYVPGNGVSGTLGYNANGNTDDWLYGEHGIFAYTIEVGLSEYGGFWPDTSMIDVLTHENLQVNLFMAWAAGQEPEIIDYSYRTFSNPFDEYSILAQIKPGLLSADSSALDSSSCKVYYRYGKEGPFDSVDMELVIPIDRFVAKIPGNGYSGIIQYYISVTDSIGHCGTWPRFAPAQLDSIVVDFPLAVDNHTGIQPTEFELLDNYPNPFNAQTVITFNVREAADLSLTIYNSLGQQVNTLATGRYNAGQYRKIWNGKDSSGLQVQSGVYFYELKYNHVQILKKMVYIQ